MSDSVLLLTPAARADLEGIWRYTAKHWSDDQAEHYTSEIVAACQALAAGIRKGRAIDDIYRGYLKLPAGSHVIFYRLSARGAVEVIRILHQRMDVSTHLP
jgi:toxin ParE1/3/4